MSEEIVSVTYSLQRKEAVARNIKTDEEVFSWVYVEGSGRGTPYPEDEMEQTGWRQLKTTIIEEVIE